jgi:hypothetical protein
MKQLLTIVCAVLLLAGCNKDKTKLFTVIATNPDQVAAVLDLDDIDHKFTDATIEREITVEVYDVMSASVDAPDGHPISLELRDGDKSLGKIDGEGHIYIVFDRDGVSSKYARPKSTGAGTGSSNGTGGGSSGSGCSTVQCTGTTQAGNRCQRTTTNCSGRCWQH